MTTRHATCSVTLRRCFMVTGKCGFVLAHGMKVFGANGVRSLDQESEWSASRLGRLNCWCPLNKSASFFQSRSGRFGDETRLLVPPGVERQFLGRPGSILVTVDTELSWQTLRGKFSFFLTSSVKFSVCVLFVFALLGSCFGPQYYQREWAPRSLADGSICKIYFALNVTEVGSFCRT